jgi:sugar/nucleoside kinase (ribokinase family)
MSKHGLFIGLVTIDFIYLVDRPPAANQKIVAIDYTVAAGGPATNAAVAFRHLGNQAELLGVVGQHPMNHLVLADLQQCGVVLSDLNPSHAKSPPVSSIVIANGERSVVSINAVKSQVENYEPFDRLQNIEIVLVDGHQMKVGIEIAQQAKKQGIPVVMDGGSWKTGSDRLLPHIDYALCSANFHPPNCHNLEQVFAYLSEFGISNIAITQGEQPIEFLHNGTRGQIPVPIVKAIDTLGAGDIFHGAFCHFILQSDFETALKEAGAIAAHACQFFGTRSWMSVEQQI